MNLSFTNGIKSFFEAGKRLADDVTREASSDEVAGLKKEN